MSGASYLFGDEAGIGKAKQANELMAHGVGKLCAIYKKFGPALG